ncbi:DUF4062 domain-containing protein [Rhizobium sp. BK376]|uniref:DUF4062 domain-containing protein n=1 Tax=Rhizobium sp. BK376 TaxID=2512149 RepID=UPI001049B05C|nr:DUF4062 domain-containing protein [Rhizobium sp. BK376]TCR89882.1 uncharacterized protein DUF4062 [Rhizobium sp. BK376]
MDEKRYQVFISSTFEDLKEERRAVQDVVISARDFPVQMESFPAADENQFDFIKSLIDQCDYYILIIAGRYGSPGSDGLSYTHKEFRYAVSKGVPVLVMLHGDLKKIEVGRSEASEEGRAKLEAFIDEAQKGRLRKSWTTLDGLKLAVREALDNAKATKPRIGWVRGDAIASLEALEELNTLRKENAELRKAMGVLEIELDLPPIPAPAEPIIIQLLPNQSRGSSVSGSAAKISAAWIDVFPLFQSNLSFDGGGYDGFYVDIDRSCVAIGSAIAGALGSIDATERFKINKETLNRLMNYYIETGLMNPVGSEVPFTEFAAKVARRHSINGAPSKVFAIDSGAIELRFVKKMSSDEDLPF